jgi:hypothetical protein
VTCKRIALGATPVPPQCAGPTKMSSNAQPPPRALLKRTAKGSRTTQQRLRSASVHSLSPPPPRRSSQVLTAPTGWQTSTFSPGLWPPLKPRGAWGGSPAQRSLFRFKKSSLRLFPQWGHTSQLKRSQLLTRSAPENHAHRLSLAIRITPKPVRHRVPARCTVRRPVL